MHRFTFATGLFLISIAHLSGMGITSAYSRYYDAGEIRPITEYFGGSLTGQGFRTVIASQPDHPEGQYFIAKLEDAKGAGATTVRMTYFISDSKKATSFDWDISGETLRGWLYLGLTGSDWSSDEVRPLAWKIGILDAGGSVLSEWKSFLWEMP